MALRAMIRINLSSGGRAAAGQSCMTITGIVASESRVAEIKAHREETPAQNPRSTPPTPG